MSEVLCLGFCCIDTVVHAPGFAIDKKVELSVRFEQGGGPAATAAVCIARLGKSVCFVGVCGDDANGQKILEGFAEESVNTQLLKCQEGKQSASAFCIVDINAGARSIAWSRGTVEYLKGADVDEQALLQAKAIHLDGHHPCAALYAAKLAKQHGVLVFLDACSKSVVSDELLENCDVVIASQQYAEKCSNSMESMLKRFRKLGVCVAMITLGGEGYLGLDEEGSFQAPAFKVNVVDSTGAGDVFHGAFICDYLEHRNARSAARFAAAAAALKCQSVGSRWGIPSREAIEAFLRKESVAHV